MDRSEEQGEGKDAFPRDFQGGICIMASRREKGLGSIYRDKNTNLMGNRDDACGKANEEL